MRQATPTSPMVGALPDGVPEQLAWGLFLGRGWRIGSGIYVRQCRDSGDEKVREPAPTGSRSRLASGRVVRRLPRQRRYRRALDA